MDTVGKIRARDFLRVSFDRSGRRRSNAEQAEDNHQAWPEWEWGEPYAEEGSASRYAARERDDWPRLIADLEHDRFGADMLVMWENSRGSRKVSEWCTLLELCEERGVQIPITTHRRIYDPANPRDVRSLIDDANDSQWESAKISMRTKRGVLANAERGEVIGGRVLHGYRRLHDEATGRYLRQVDHPDEAPDIAELFERVRRGHSIRSIERDLVERQEQRGGRVLNRRAINLILRNPAYIGKRVYIPGGSRQTTTAAMMSHPDAMVTEAAWPALVDEATFWAVQRILDDPSRRTTRRGRGLHLLGMIALCDPCDGELAAKYRAQGRRYMCQPKGCVTVDADELDAFVEEVVLGYLSRPDVHELLGGGEDDDVELEKVRAEIEQLRHALGELEEQLKSREISPRMAGAAEAQYAADLEHLEARERELITPSQLAGIIEPGEDVVQRWAELPMSAKRTVVKLVTVPDLLGEIRVTRSTSRKAPVEERVRWAKDPQLS